MSAETRKETAEIKTEGDVEKKDEEEDLEHRNL